MHAKRVCKDFEVKNVGEYHDLYLKSNTLLLADVFEEFRDVFKNFLFRFCKISFSSWSSMASSFKKTEVKLELLTDIDMLLMLRRNMNKYMKDYNENKDSSYLKYWDVNNLYGWEMSQKFPVNNFEWIRDTSQFNEVFIKSYNEESDEGYFFEIEIQYPEKVHELQNKVPFLPERMKIEKVEKLITNSDDKTEYVIQIRNLNQASNHGLVLEKVYKGIKFNQNAWLKPYIDMNTKLRKKAKNNFDKSFFKLMNNTVVGKTIKNMRKHRNIKLVTTERRTNY